MACRCCADFQHSCVDAVPIDTVGREGNRERQGTLRRWRELLSFERKFSWHFRFNCFFAGLGDAQLELVHTECRAQVTRIACVSLAGVERSLNSDAESQRTQSGLLYTHADLPRPARKLDVGRRKRFQRNLKDFGERFQDAQGRQRID
jgi:hypothetical protein